MTICVASIGSKSTILGASDRMLTAGDIQFQPPQSKIRPLTTSIFLMIAGDINIHSEIYQETKHIIDDRIKKEPDNWWKVKDVAEIYSRVYYDLLSKRSEKEILWPLGLTKDNFIKRQNEMIPDFVNKISLNLSKFCLRDTGAIITGLDDDLGNIYPHIYVIENGNVECHDDIGFASIGAGYWHANSQFMFSGYTKFASQQKQLFDTFWAKKRAEVAPGVGKATDMFVMPGQLGLSAVIPEDFILSLEKIYETYKLKVKKADDKSLKSVEQFLLKLSKETTQQSEPQQVQNKSPEVKPPEKKSEAESSD